MKCVAVCQDDLVVKTLHQSLVPALEVEFIVDDRALARRLHDAGISVSVGDPKRVDTYLKADVTAGYVRHHRGTTAAGARRRVLEAVTDAGALLVYLLSVGDRGSKRSEDWTTGVPRSDRPQPG